MKEKERASTTTPLVQARDSETMLADGLKQEIGGGEGPEVGIEAWRFPLSDVQCKEGSWPKGIVSSKNLSGMLPAGV